MNDPRYRLALEVIAVDSCEAFTTGRGSCLKTNRTVDSRYGIDRVCGPCVAWAALNNKLLPTGRGEHADESAVSAPRGFVDYDRDESLTFSQYLSERLYYGMRAVLPVFESFYDGITGESWSRAYTWDPGDVEALAAARQITQRILEISAVTARLDAWENGVPFGSPITVDALEAGREVLHGPPVPAFELEAAILQAAPSDIVRRMLEGAQLDVGRIRVGIDPSSSGDTVVTLVVEADGLLRMFPIPDLDEAMQRPVEREPDWRCGSWP